MRRRARSPRGRPRSGMARLASFGCADADNAIFPMGRDETAVSRSAEGRLVLLDFVSVKGAFTWPAPERFDPGNAEEIASRPVSRVLYGAKRFLAARVMAIPLGRSLPTASGDQPGRRPGDRPAGHWPTRRPYSVLLPAGLAMPGTSPSRRCALTAPFHPCRDDGLRRPDRAAVCFLWRFPWGRPRRTLSGAVSPWSPDFPLPCGSGHPADWLN